MTASSTVPRTIRARIGALIARAYFRVFPRPAPPPKKTGLPWLDVIPAVEELLKLQTKEARK